MAELASTRVYGKLTVMHEAIVKANAEIVGNVTAAKFIGDGSQLTALPWGQLTGVPSTFAPGSHTHPWGEVTGKPTTATRWPAWGEVTGKPSTYAPSSHNHDDRYYTETEVDALFAGLSTTPDWTDVLNKPATATRWPAWGEVTGKPTTFTPVSHDHPWTEVTGKPTTATRWPSWSEVSSKPSTFAPSSHTHPLSQITGAGDLASLSTNASTTAFLRGDGTWATPPDTNTTYSEISTAEIDAGTASTRRTISGRRIKYALDKKADTVHGHSISDVTGLQTELDTKVDKVVGKGLSTEDFTSAEKDKLAELENFDDSSIQAELDTKADTTYVNTQLDSKVNKTVSVVAGTGLSGGGALSTNRTLNVQYGTAAGTAAQGNDSRLSNSREWTASVVTQAEAEAGTATSARKWTAQRVRQANESWWSGSTDKSKLDGIASGATANATDAQLRARSSHTGSQAISTITGLVTALDGKVDTSDARLTNSRDWSATVVTQAEAQAGSSSTARKWSAQRVAQAISALGLKTGTTASTAKPGNWMPTWANVTGKPTTFTPASHTHSLSEVTDAGDLAALSTNASTANFLRGDGTWVTPPNTNTTYSEITTAEIDAGTASTSRTISGRRMKYALDKKSDTGHGHVIGDVTGLQAAIDSKADTTTQVIAGTGLSGGGTLAANRTLSVSYGTAAGTAAQGNDSRLSNSREWTASTVSQAEAQAGTATTRRAWTAQRVRQAIDAAVNAAVPSGVITMWSGEVSAIPAGWVLCNGQNGTPDLRARFIVGAGGASYDPGDRGGTNSVTLTTAQIPAHNHSVTVNSGGSHNHTASTGSAGSHNHSGTASSAGAHSHPVQINNGSGSTTGAHPFRGIPTGSTRYQNNKWDTVATRLRTTSAGAHTHSLSINSGGAHTHTVTVANGGAHTHTASSANTGSGNSHENRPPYHALAYIMKL